MINGKKIAIFLAAAAVTLVLDLGTKWWAAGSLASFEHPLPVTVGESEAGKTLEELLHGRELVDVTADSVMRLSPPLDTDKSPAFPVSRITKDRAYYLFESAARTSPPLFLSNPALREFRQRREEGLTREEWKASWQKRQLAWSEYISAEFPYLSDDEVAALLKERLVHPIPMHVSHVAGSVRVKAGETYLVVSRTIEIVPGFLRFIYAENPGAAWGLLRDASLFIRIFFLQFVSLLAMGLILYVTYKVPEGQLISVAALAMIFGGAVGNFVERFGRLAVVDFIDMYVRDSHWPTYNVADIGITVGVALLFIQMLRKQSPF